MKLVIDLQGAQSDSRFRGIGRYSLSLALAIARNAGKHEVWLALSAAFPESIEEIYYVFKDLIPKEHIRILEVPIPLEELNPKSRPRTRVAELLYERFLEQLEPDIVLISSIFDEGYLGPSIASVGNYTSSYLTAAILYDLIPLLNADHYLADPDLRDYYMRRVESLKKTDLLLSISDSSGLEAVEALEIPREKIANISCAVDESFRPASLSKEEKEKLRQRYGIDDKVVMYAPGGFDKRKNFEGLIEAYSRLPGIIRKEYQLAIVSKIHQDDRHRLERFAQKQGLPDRELILTGYVSNEDLIALYSTADLFVFPSKHEGFGLPVLEAMACSAPVIGSDATSIPEVIGWDRALFDPDSIESMTAKMREVIENREFRKSLVAHAKTQVKHFSWDQSAKLALESMENMLEKKTPESKSEKHNIIEAISQVYIIEKPEEGDLEQFAYCLSFNTREPKQLFLDISVLVNTDLKSGVQRVVRSLLLEILNNPPATYIVKPIYFDNKQYRHARKFVTQITGTYSGADLADEAVDFRQDDIYLALDITAHLVHVVKDIYAYMQRMGVNVYFIIYDILFAKHPEWWVDAVSKNLNEWLECATEVSTGLLCISEAVAGEIEEWMVQHPPKRLSPPVVKSFHLGADIENSAPSTGLPDDAGKVLEQVRSVPSFLVVGTVEPRKGHHQTLEAFDKLWDEGEDINLVIVGKEGWKVEDLFKKLRSHPEKGQHLFWLEGISDEYLKKLYAASACLIAASEAEGFGLPLIEAAQHKLPIIARDIPVFREVAGKYAFYFNNDKKPHTLTDAIKKWLELYRENQHPKSNDMPWLIWKESAGQLLSILTEGSSR